MSSSHGSDGHQAADDLLHCVNDVGPVAAMSLLLNFISHIMTSSENGTLGLDWGGDRIFFNKWSKRKIYQAFLTVNKHKQTNDKYRKTSRIRVLWKLRPTPFTLFNGNCCNSLQEAGCAWQTHTHTIHKHEESFFFSPVAVRRNTLGSSFYPRPKPPERDEELVYTNRVRSQSRGN